MTTKNFTFLLKEAAIFGWLNGVNKLEPYDFLIIEPLHLRFPPLTQFEHTHLANPFLVTWQTALYVLSPSHTGLTTRLPTCDRKMLESSANRRKNIRLVAWVVGDRQSKIGRSKFDGHVQNV